jgi:hypothetical protein
VETEATAEVPTEVTTKSTEVVAESSHPGYSPEFYSDLDKALIGAKQLLRRELTLALAEGDRASTLAGGHAAVSGDPSSNSSDSSNNNINININIPNSNSSSSGSYLDSNSSVISGTISGGGSFLMTDLLTVLRHAGLHSSAVEVESLVWLAWMSHPDPSMVSDGDGDCSHGYCDGGGEDEDEDECNL